jgi:hypothetical protein
MEIKEVTPEQARQWLRTTKQRAINLERVMPLVEAMEQGNFDINSTPNDPIRVRRGILEDGNHRLTAVMIYGKPVILKTLVQ